MYGDGTEHDHLLGLIQKMGLVDKAFIYPGRSDVHEVVRDAAMFVLPSNYEGLSNSMLEAMAIGLPVICTDCPCGGARMVIRDGENGYLIPVGDKDALLAKMRLLCGSGFTVGNQVRNFKNRFSSGQIACKWLSIIER